MAQEIGLFSHVSRVPLCGAKHSLKTRCANWTHDAPLTRNHRLTNPGSQKQSIFYAFFGFGFFSGTLVPENLLNLLWLILKPYKTFMHKHTFSGPGVRLKRARTLGPEKSRTLEFSNPADPDLGPGEFENHMKCFHVLTNPTHEMNFDLCFFCACPKCSI